MVVNCVFGISRWSNPNRAAAMHIDDGSGGPLCGGAGRKVLSWEPTREEPTCAKCIRLGKPRPMTLAQAREKAKEKYGIHAYVRVVKGGERHICRKDFFGDVVWPKTLGTGPTFEAAFADAEAKKEKEQGADDPKTNQ